jgi:hypothetical protein
MHARLAVLLVLMAGHLAFAQQVESPSQEETLAKYPWSIALQPGPFKQESITIALEPGEGMEYKYRLAEAAGLLYSWTSTAELHYELHSQPDNAPQGYAEFFDTNQSNQGHGVYKAPFTGIHGWWWENQSQSPVTITLTAAGFYTETHEFRRDQPVKITTFE